MNAAAMLPELLLDGATPGEQERALTLLDDSGRVVRPRTPSAAPC